MFLGRDEEKQQLVARPVFISINILGAAGGRGPANLLSTAGDGGERWKCTCSVLVLFHNKNCWKDVGPTGDLIILVHH